MIKKIIFLSLLIFVVGACKKRYSCGCKTTLNFGSQGGQQIYYTEAAPISEKMTKKQATAVCSHEKETINKSYTNDATNNGTQPARYSASTICKLE